MPRCWTLADLTGRQMRRSACGPAALTPAPVSCWPGLVVKQAIDPYGISDHPVVVCCRRWAGWGRSRGILPGLAWVDGFAASEHVDVLGQLAVPSRRTLDGVEPVDNGVAIGCVQLVERRGCGGIGCQRLGQIGRGMHVGLPAVGRLPPSLRLGRVDGRDPGWLHASSLGKASDVLDVPGGPGAVRPAGREALAIPIVVTSC